MTNTSGSSNDQNFCIHCSAPLQTGSKFCQECGKETKLGAGTPQEQRKSHDEGTESESGSDTLSTVGKGSAYLWGAFLMILALGLLSIGTTGSKVSGVIVLLMGFLFFPIVRDGVGIGNLPGIGERHSGRRNVLTGIGYGMGSLFVSVLGLTAGAGTSNSDVPDTDSGDVGDGGSNGIQDTPTEESYPDAYAYEAEIGIVLRDVEAVVGQYNSEITGTAENVSKNNYDYVQVEFGLYDSTDAKVGDALANTSGLEAGQRWRFEAFSGQTESVESYRLEDISAF